MGGKSKIEWTEATWNPIVGCSVVSPGCTNCYAMKMAGRLEAMARAAFADDRPAVSAHYLGTTQDSKAGPVWTGKVNLAPERILLKPLSWKRPGMIFVNSMSDLFHENVPDIWIDRVFSVMASARQHTFQILTKRSDRMRAYFRDLEHRAIAIGAITDIADLLPLSNVWLGVSAEDQKRADERIPHLLETPAALRFVSAEPLLGPIDFRAAASAALPKMGRDAWVNARLDWIIVGGESGPNARPMHPDWARSIRDQCAAAGAPFFFKQWGEHVTGYLDGDEFHPDEETHGPNVHWNGTARCFDIPGDSGHYGRVGKRAAGRLLDGCEHNEMPEVRS